MDFDSDSSDSESESLTESDSFECDELEDVQESTVTNTAATFEKELEEEKQELEELKQIVKQCEINEEDVEVYQEALRLSVEKLARSTFMDITNLFHDGNTFLICGDSLLLNMIGNPSWNSEHGGQMLHLIYLCERLLQLLSRKGGQFEIVFFKVWEYVWTDQHTILLAREVLMAHLRANTSIKVLQFESIWDPSFQTYLISEKPSFLLVSFQLQLTCEDILPQQKIILADICFYRQILFSISNGLPCVDMSNIELHVSTLHAFLIDSRPEFLKGLLLKLRKNLDKVMKSEIQNLELNCRSWTTQFESKFFQNNQDIRRVVSVTAAAWYLIEESTPTNKEDWVRVFLLYSTLLEVLPLKFRGSQPSAIKPSKELTDFISQMNCHMRRALQSVPDALYCQHNVADLWHGHLFISTLVHLNSIPLMKDISELGHHTKDIYRQLIHEVNMITGNNLQVLPVTEEKLNFSEEVDNTSSVEEVIDTFTEPSQTSLSELEKLIPTSCQLTHEFCGEFLLDMLKQAEQYDSRIDSLITKDEDFLELHHWHSHAPLTDEHDRIKNNSKAPKDPYEKKWYLKNQVAYARYMSVYGSNIEGRPLTQRPIVCKRENKKEKKKKVSQKGLKLIEKNIKSKQKKLEENEKIKFSNFMKLYKTLKSERKYSSALKEVNILLKNLHTEVYIHKALMSSAEIYHMIWHDECVKRKNPADRDLTHAKDFFLILRRILKQSKENKIPLNELDAKQIGIYLCELGFEEVAKEWQLPIQPQDEKFAVGTSWVRFQLSELGPELERVTDGVPDNRVDFIPDPWQKKLFDIIDQRQSAVIVAPTSSGKTYASYYCMESVLREDNEGIVVYISPTKALVNQVAATVYARFKDKKMPPGKSVYGVFTRDYRINDENCQILITVPQCLELLLLSPRRHAWVQRLRYVIFDEIHCLAGQAGGISWECGLLLIQCPFIALSATVHKPEILHNWLQEAMNFKQQRDKLDGCFTNAKSYRVHLVVHQERHNDLKKYSWSPIHGMCHLHPYAQVDSTVVRNHGGIPANISLSPEETLQLYSSMESVAPQHPKVTELKPETFFQGSSFLTKSDARNYGEKLKCVLEEWALKNDSYYQSTVANLNVEFEDTSGKEHIRRNIIQIVQQLQKNKMFPAIFFLYDRNLIDYFYEMLTEHFKAQQEVEDQVDDNLSRKDRSTSEPDRREPRESKRKSDARVSRKEKYTKSLSLLQGSSRGTLRNTGLVDSDDLKYIERRLIRDKCNRDFSRGLAMGLGKHHGGLNAIQRSAVEMLFRMKVLSLAFATGTLSLGIHMPCKTVVIVGESPYLNTLEYHQMSGRAGRRGFDSSGNVIFFGVQERKMRTLLTGKLPEMIGNFPLTVTLVLRLLLLVSKVTNNSVRDEKTTSDALSRALTFLNCSLAYQKYPQLKAQMKHFFAFSTQLLILQGFLDDKGNPQLFSGLITHLHYHEPGSFIFVHLFRSGALRRLCQEDQKNKKISRETQQNMILVLSYLFTRKRLPALDLNREFKNSIVILPPLPDDIQQEIQRYNKEVLFVYDHYFKQVAAYCAETMGEDDKLPLSNVRFAPTTPFKPTCGDNNLETMMIRENEPREICSAFAALSGHTDRNMYSPSNMFSNIRHQVSTEYKVIPYMDYEEHLNAYAWDFYNHGNYKAIERDNGLKAGDAFNMLKDFMLVLRSIYMCLDELGAYDENDLLLRVFRSITNNYSALFYKAFGGKYEPV